MRPLWSQLTEFIGNIFAFPHICNPLLDLLGVIEDEELDVATKLFL